ncbi:MAG TPA: SAV_6107 family HEPN domain-containing protein [Polyangiaceae bacterium]|nr:SAV_6107 family HEPN domain-containing protein [Polyangiaceae bacterium]
MDPTDPIAAALDAAEFAPRPAERYLLAHAAALRVAAEALSGRPRARGVLRTIDGSPRNVWSALPLVAPELGEWAAYFATLEDKRRVVAAGAVALVGEREADDLVRDARAFADAAFLGRRRREPEGAHAAQRRGSAAS